jgi:hypothetical protein
LNSSNTFAKLYARLVRKGKKRGSKRSHEKRIQGFHMAWVVIQTLAMWDVVETVDVVVVAEEVIAEVPVQPCLGRHLRLVPAKI